MRALKVLFKIVNVFFMALNIDTIEWSEGNQWTDGFNREPKKDLRIVEEENIF